MNIIRNELKKMGITYDNVSLIQNKSGVVVARISKGQQSYVIKCFANKNFKREITNYQLLSSLQIPTIKVISSTNSAILLEDITCSDIYRLGLKQDMNNPEIARSIAKWYKMLHQRGYEYAKIYQSELYDEADFFTLENIKAIRKKTKTQELSAWQLLEQHFDVIKQRLCDTRKTLTYNDFYYTNLVVKKDYSSAMMFDYNLLGKGYIYTDLRNVTTSLSPEAREAFFDEYGMFDPLEAAIDSVVCPVVTLHLACQRKHLPSWATNTLKDVKTTFEQKIQQLIDL